MAKPLTITVATLALGLSVPSLAEDSHHPAAATAQAQQTPQTPQASPSRPMQPGMGPGPGMGMGQGRMMDQDRMGPGMMGPGMMGQGMMGPGGMSGMMPMMGMMDGDERIEGRLAFLKAELGITEAQEKAWAEFADAMRQAAAKTQGAHMRMRPMSGMAGGDMTLPQLVDQHESNLAARLEAVRTVKSALGPFYAALDEQQKETLAQLHPMFRRFM